MKSRAVPRIPSGSAAASGPGEDSSGSPTKTASPKYRQDNRPRVETDLLIAGIRKRVMKASQTLSKDECITMLITACIEKGFDIGPRIEGISCALGFNAQQTNIILNRGAGNGSGPQLWHKGPHGRYHLQAS